MAVILFILFQSIFVGHRRDILITNLCLALRHDAICCHANVSLVQQSISVKHDIDDCIRTAQRLVRKSVPSNATQ